MLGSGRDSNGPEEPAFKCEEQSDHQNAATGGPSAGHSLPSTDWGPREYTQPTTSSRQHGAGRKPSWRDPCEKRHNLPSIAGITMTCCEQQVVTGGIVVFSSCHKWSQVAQAVGLQDCFFCDLSLGLLCRLSTCWTCMPRSSRRSKQLCLASLRLCGW